MEEKQLEFLKALRAILVQTVAAIEDRLDIPYDRSALVKRPFESSALV